jgi:glycosyltransferase involved in cell wall biosynthesis
MRIVIDMQGAQSTGSRTRGIGRYSLALAEAMLRQRGDHKVLIAVNALFPDTIHTIRERLNGLMPQENIRLWQAPWPVSFEHGNTWRRRAAELSREAFLASLEPDMVLVTSLFEGLGDDAVTSIGALSRDVPTAVIHYDLIPLIYRNPYLVSPPVEAWYENKLDHLRRAHLLLAISESSRQEVIRCLGLSEETVVNISTAAHSHFGPELIDDGREQQVLQRYGIEKPFVMYTGGIDHRKNIDGLIRAYANLPSKLRAEHQLAVVCSIENSSRTALEEYARKQGLGRGDLRLTGFVPENDLQALYNLCKVFVFPSLHEGFGLPALEAMTCGRAVIASNTSSLPEVIGREDALFDPRNDAAIGERLARVLVDESFRKELERHGLKQAKRFSWDVSARRALDAIEARHSKSCGQRRAVPRLLRRPKLAYVSPLPPAQSGISDYSVELLPHLTRNYEVDVVVEEPLVSNPWVKAVCPVRTVEWFKHHIDRYDRVLYHFGNSRFHQHMLPLLEAVPGIVVLHDFYLSGAISYADITGLRRGCWAEALYVSHGYSAVQQRFHAKNDAEVQQGFPCNLAVLQGALGVIVHSEYPRRLAREWYGDQAADDWQVIPILRNPVFHFDKATAREALNLQHDEFVICSFGLIGPTKLNHRLLKAWAASALAKDDKCVLIFVGENHMGEYGVELLASIRLLGLGRRIRITGWADTTTFNRYLAAADLGVQLRTFSRGETSSAVLDCMKYGLATVVNANGSMAELPEDSVWKLPDQFEDAELIEGLETLWRDTARRARLSMRAREKVLREHAPALCAERYVDVIERSYRKEAAGIGGLARAVASLGSEREDPQQYVALAEAIVLSIPPAPALRQLLIDVSALMQRDKSEGAPSRTPFNLLRELLGTPPSGYRVEPVYASANRGYLYARRFSLRILGCPDNALSDDPIEFQAGDRFVVFDLEPRVLFEQRGRLQRLGLHGIDVRFVVFDFVLDSAQRADEYREWPAAFAESNGVVCVTQAAAERFNQWLTVQAPQWRKAITLDPLPMEGANSYLPLRSLLLSYLAIPEEGAVHQPHTAEMRSTRYEPVATGCIQQ